MKFYYAPLEGVGGYIYRNAHNAHFNHHHIKKYFAPFIVADQNSKFTSKDRNDLDPDNNLGLVLIPQILTNKAQDFIYTAHKIQQLGYTEVNLNLGCPSGTVVAKKKGSGFLAFRDELDQFLEDIFSEQVTDISIKTRIGRDHPEEFVELMKIYNKYPLKELIIHPRTQKDLYKNTPNLQVFKEALATSRSPICYNGDIFNVEDYMDFIKVFPEVDTIMLGRGLLANPGFVDLLMDDQKMDKKTLRAFHDQIYDGYKTILFGDRNVLFKMKEVWNYLIQAFSHHEKYGKKIKKTDTLQEYNSIVASLFNEQDILDNFGHLR